MLSFLEITLSGFGCMEIDSNNLFMNFIMMKKIRF